MHFWIDKRHQCGYSGRRVPCSLSSASASGSARARRERYAKRMVTPVHRFQSVECVGGSARRPPPPPPPPPPVHHHRPREPHASVYDDSTIGNGAAYPPRRNSRRPYELESDAYLEMPHADAAHGVEVSPRIHVSPPQQLMPAHLKCGMWASFALATMFVAGAKFYFDHKVVYDQGSGMEVLILCALLVVFLLGACTITLCKARTVPPLPVVSIPPASPPIHAQDSTEDLALGTLLSLQAIHQPAPPSPEPPPPPYHIAVLLPQRNVIQVEAPPPTYEKAIS